MNNRKYILLFITAIFFTLFIAYPTTTYAKENEKADFYKHAKKWADKPNKYVFGGSHSIKKGDEPEKEGSKIAWDCSSYVTLVVYDATGIWLAPDDNMGYTNNMGIKSEIKEKRTKLKGWDELKTGDVVFFSDAGDMENSSHVGIMVKDDVMAHSDLGEPSGAKFSKEDYFKDSWTGEKLMFEVIRLGGAGGSKDEDKSKGDAKESSKSKENEKESENTGNDKKEKDPNETIANRLGNTEGKDVSDKDGRLGLQNAQEIEMMKSSNPELELLENKSVNAINIIIQLGTLLLFLYITTMTILYFTLSPNHSAKMHRKGFIGFIDSHVVSTKSKFIVLGVYFAIAIFICLISSNIHLSVLAYILEHLSL